MKIEKECTGYTYTSVDDDDRSDWKVETSYMYETLYLNEPSEGSDIADFAAYGRAICKACRDMKRDMKDNRFEVK